MLNYRTLLIFNVNIESKGHTDKYIQMHFECWKSVVAGWNLVEQIFDYIGDRYSLSDLPLSLTSLCQGLSFIFLISAVEYYQNRIRNFGMLLVFVKFQLWKLLIAYRFSLYEITLNVSFMYEI